MSYISHQTDAHFSDISIIILRSENPEWYISTYYTKIWEYTTQNRYISLLKAIAIITMKQADIWMLHTLGGGPPVGQVRQGDVIKDTKCQNLSGVQLFGHSFSSSKRNSSRVPRRGPRRWPHVNGLMWSSAGLICCLLSRVLMLSGRRANEIVIICNCILVKIETSHLNQLL